MGRLRKSPHERRDKTVAIAFNARELEKLEVAARLGRRKVSDLARKIVLDHVDEYIERRRPQTGPVAAHSPFLRSLYEKYRPELLADLAAKPPGGEATNPLDDLPLRDNDLLIDPPNRDPD